MLENFYNRLLDQLRTDGSVYAILSSQYFLWAMGIATVYIGIKIILRSFSRTILCLLDNKSGKVFIKKSVLKETIQDACKSLGMQIKPKIDISCKSKKINIRISIAMASNQKLPDVSTTLQKHLHIVLADDIGIKNINKIDVVIIGLNRNNLSKTEITKEL
ncbi:MAG: hypothetical protein LBI37_00705 [Puniceicoccales bacterium]|jgi:hypothetical protein|nr:hypothetical protein [Puniceicoccales bacterium]